MLLAPLTTRYHIITRYRHISNTIGEVTVCAVLINEVNTHLPTHLLTHLLINLSSKQALYYQRKLHHSSRLGKRNPSRRYLTRYLATYIYGQSSQLDYHFVYRKRRRSKQEGKIRYAEIEIAKVVSWSVKRFSVEVYSIYLAYNTYLA